MRVSIQVDPIHLDVKKYYDDDSSCRCDAALVDDKADNDDLLLKEWILDQYRDEFLAAITIVRTSKDDDESSNNDDEVLTADTVATTQLDEKHKEEEDLLNLDSSQQSDDSDSDRVVLLPEEERQSKLIRKDKKLEILDCVASVQRMFLENQPLNEVFQFLLASLLQFQQSEFALIGELKMDEDTGREYMTAYARASSEEKQFFASPAEFRFTSTHSLFMEIVHKQQTVIANDAPNDPRASGSPPGHPVIHNFLGIPFFKQNEVIGMVVIANRDGGYSEDDVDFLEPFLLTCSSIIQAYAQMRENRLLIDTLELKVKERTQKLKHANEQLEAANRRVVEASQAQLRHFACMSHEIRTPLNCIIGLSSLLTETQLTPMQKESMRMISSSGDLLLTVVNDVLDYSKLETGNVEISVRRSNLQETLNAIIHSIQTKAASKNIRLRTFYDTEVPEYFYTDCRRLQQILYNLLGNAIKFSPHGAFIDLGVHLCSRETEPRQGEFYPSRNALHKSGTIRPSMNSIVETDCISSMSSFCDSLQPLPTPEELHSSPFVLRFVVKDYGQGIAKDDYKRIFQPFRQASSETERVYGGTGLGLPITAKLVHGLGGTISLASTPGEWSRFTVDLPFENSVPIDKEPLSITMSKATILLVAEENYDRDQACQYFEAFNLEFRTFLCAEDFEEAAQAENFVEEDRRYICMFQETLFVEKCFKTLESKSDKTVLLTFGHAFGIKQSQGHFRSLYQVLPSVLVKYMSSFMLSSDKQGAGQRTSQEALPALKSQYTGYRVLVAEDNRVNQRVLLRMLNRIGIKNIDFADNGKLAVEAEAKHQYEVVLMDMQMPIMDGLEACKVILNRKEGHPLPTVIFVTAHVSTTYESLCEKAGGAGFLSKPFNIQDLAKTFQGIYLERYFEPQEDAEHGIH